MKAAAAEAALAELQSSTVTSPIRSSHPPLRHDVRRNSRAPSESSSTASSMNEVLERLVSYNLRSNMPKVEIEPFDGDYTKFRAFLKSFDAAVGSRTDEEEEKLLYLIQYCRGVPKDLVKSCVHMPENGYKQARKLLEKRYGRNSEMVNKYVEKILDWPAMKATDYDKLDQFAILLLSAGNALTAIKPGFREIEHTKTISQIIAKLPFSWQERWRRVVDRCVREDDEDSVGYEKLVDFVQTRCV